MEGSNLKASGFTLVELAIILVLVGILVSIGASMIGPLTKRAKLIETRETITGAVDSVIGFAASRNRLPDLSASPSATSFWTNVRTQNDAWVNRLVYVFDNNLVTSICNRTTTNITIRVCSNAACSASTVVNNVAFVVLSAGDNANDQTYGSLAINVATTINTYPVGMQVDNYAGDFTRATDEYDDIAKWMTLSELQTKMACTQQQCTAYQVYNNLGGNRYFRTNGLACLVVANNALISGIGPGGSINGYTNAACSTAAVPASLSYTTSAAMAAIDTNGNCAINYSGSDR